MPELRWAEIAALPSFFGSSKNMELENCVKKQTCLGHSFYNRKFLFQVNLEIMTNYTLFVILGARV